MAVVDFHMHSLYSSDGEFTPQELVDMAFRSGIKALSLTDHNTVRGTKEMMEAGKAAGITVISGIELDCYYEKTVFHVLGYGIDPQNKKILEIEKDVFEKSKKASNEFIRRIKNEGIDVDAEELFSRASDGIIIGELIAEVAFHKPGAEKNKIIAPYLPGGSRSDNPYVNFYWDFCAPGKPAYVEIDYISLDDVIAVIEEAGGVPVLAHPGQMLRESEITLSAVCSRGIKGIEAYSNYHSPAENAHYVEQGKQLGLFITGGSDFHGKTKPSVKMGQFGFDGEGWELTTDLLHI